MSDEERYPSSEEMVRRAREGVRRHSEDASLPPTDDEPEAGTTELEPVAPPPRRRFRKKAEVRPQWGGAGDVRRRGAALVAAGLILLMGVGLLVFFALVESTP